MKCYAQEEPTEYQIHKKAKYKIWEKTCFKNMIWLYTSEGSGAKNKNVYIIRYKWVRAWVKKCTWIKK